MYDLVVIGGGSAGLTSAIMAGEIGAKVLLVDRERFGGDCTWYGCVPSKALIASAKAAQSVRRAGRYGVSVPEPEVDFAVVMARVRAVRAGIGAQETAEQLAHHGVDSAFGVARFVDPHTLQIGDDRSVQAAKFVICTGSRPSAPPIDGLADAGYLDNHSLFELTEHPGRVLIIGAGPIGCEMGQALGRLGVPVTLVEMGDRVLGREDPEVSALLADVLREEGIDLRLGAEVQRVERQGDERVVTLSIGDRTDQVVCDTVLVAVGRRANIESLGLEAAGVQTHGSGIQIDDGLATSQPHIFAAGDCTGGPQFTHWAELEARVATRNALFRGAESRVKTQIPWCTFTDPEVARVGVLASEATGAHVHTVPLSKVDRYVTEGHAQGFIKVVVDGSDRILGVHIVGAEAGELLAEWVLALKCGLTLSEIGQAVHVYPTRTRANRRVADEAFFAHNIAGWKKTLFGTWKGRDT